jgi:riboflavin kinase/FMN adenylyltransferase
MEIIHLKHPPQINLLPPSSVAFGNFDGVHKGHRKVIGQAMMLAKREGLEAGLVTFHPHPKDVLTGSTSYCLTPIEEKLRLFSELKLDFVIIIHFDITFSKLSPEAFIEEYIVKLNIKHVVTGFDFSFGYRGAGSFETLSAYSRSTEAFQAHMVPPLTYHDEKISSSRIRQLLAEGDVTQAAQLLDRPYLLSGSVIHGEKRGRQLGFPTANLKLSADYVMPRTGVYAVKVIWHDELYPAILNLGYKPTFHNSAEMRLSIEAHLFNFKADLYHQHISVLLISFIRPEHKFQSIQQLISQIELDITQAKQVLNQA